VSLKVDANTVNIDKRGTMVDLLRSQTSFLNVSKGKVTIYATTPVAWQIKPDLIVSRLGGFLPVSKKKGKGRRQAGGVSSYRAELEPGQTATYKIFWKGLSSVYMPMRTVQNYTPSTPDDPAGNGLYMTLCCVAITIADVNPQTGEAYNPLDRIVEYKTSVTYTVRPEVDRNIDGNLSIRYVEVPQFGVDKLAKIDDIFYVNVIDGMVSRNGLPALEGESVPTVMLGEGRVYGYVVNSVGLVTLSVTTFDGRVLPVNLSEFRNKATRVVTQFNIPGAVSATFALVNGNWVLWDENTQSAMLVPSLSGTSSFPLSTTVPVTTCQIPDRTNSKISPLGYVVGDPKAFGDTVRTFVGVVRTIASVADSALSFFGL